MFNDLTSNFVQDFDYYLRDNLTLNHNTIWNYMIGFTTLCRLAMSRKHLAFNPFSEYKNTKGQRQRLSVAERVGTACNVQLREKERRIG